jgi:hypothetical protein
MPKSVEHEITDLLLLGGYLIGAGRSHLLHCLQLKWCRKGDKLCGLSRIHGLSYGLFRAVQLSLISRLSNMPLIIVTDPTTPLCGVTNGCRRDRRTPVLSKAAVDERVTHKTSDWSKGVFHL